MYIAEEESYEQMKEEQRKKQRLGTILPEPIVVNTNQRAPA